MRKLKQDSRCYMFCVFDGNGRIFYRSFLYGCSPKRAREIAYATQRRLYGAGYTVDYIGRKAVNFNGN